MSQTEIEPDFWEHEAKRLMEERDLSYDQVAKLNKQLELELDTSEKLRMQLAACGVAALCIPKNPYESKDSPRTVLTGVLHMKMSVMLLIGRLNSGMP